MGFYVEPVYLNEKMVLNCAAYTFKGIAIESEFSEEKRSKNQGSLSIGFKFLQDLLSPISAAAEQQKESTVATKTARRYTLGGLHMALIDALDQEGRIKKYAGLKGSSESEEYIEIDAILRPVDFYSIIESLKISSPIIFQFLQNFGDKINPQIFTKNLKSEIGKYEELLRKILAELESDYLKSGQLEMIMMDPKTGKQFGVVDVDVSELNALSIKAKLTDGRFKIFGRISRVVDDAGSISLVQRTALSGALEIVERVAGVGGQREKYKEGMLAARNLAQQICQLSLPGPAIRVVAMSICI